jgi:hypothetical protein
LSFQNVTLSYLIHEINDVQICQGVTYKSDYILSHSVPKIYTPGESPIRTSEFDRPKDCLLLGKSEKCSVCYLKDQQHLQYKRKENRLQEPAKPNAPVTLTSPERLKLTMQNYRIENKELKNQVEKLQKELKRPAIPTS